MKSRSISYALLAVSVLLGGTLVTGCGGGSSGSDGGSNGGSGSGLGRSTITLHGTATTTFTYANGTVKTFQQQAQVSTTPPLSAGGATESNPFDLLIVCAQSISVPSAEGDVEMDSAQTGYTPQSGQPYELQFWNLTSSGSNLNGTLATDNGLPGSTGALDLVNVDSGFGPLPYPIALGATVSGTLTATSANLRLAGTSSNDAVRFVTEIKAP